MGIKRINEFPEGSGLLSSDDIFVFMDNPSGSGITKKISLSEISNAIGIGTSFEIASVDLHNGGVQTAQVLQFDDDSEQSVITGPTPPSGNSSQRIIIQGQRAQGGGEGGDVYVWGGDADINGGDIKIYAGDADNVSPDNGYGGYVNIDGGEGATTGGNVEITAGYSAGGQAGDVSIVAGSTSSGVSGDVKIKTNNDNNNWTFDASGSLTLPTSGTITFPDNSIQTTAYIPSTITTYLLHEYADPSGFSTPTSITIDGMSYGGGQVVVDSAFGPNSSRVTLYSDSMFAIVAVDADIDTVYYNGETGSDGDGDKTVSAGVSNYRGYYSYHNLISGDDPAIQQIVISKSSTMSGSNRSTDTDSDDFTVTGLSGSDVVIVLNLYWAEDVGPDYSSSTTVAIQQFIDLVMFDEATPRTNINNIRTAFYDNSAAIKTAIENEESDLLYDGFEFYRSFQKVTPSGGSGSDAILEIEIFNDGGTGENDMIYDDQDVLVIGTGYQIDDTLTVLGDLLGGTTPTNDVTITVTNVDPGGGIIDYAVSGTAVNNLWPDSYIIDGNSDQYDIGNFIGTNRTRATATVTLAYETINGEGGGEGGGSSDFQILTVLSTNKTISEGQWAWFEEDNNGAFINYTLATTDTLPGIPSNTDLVPNSVSITNIVSISQANYDALVTKDSSTLYVIS